MDFQVTSAFEKDISRLTDIQFAAFENDPTHQILFPGDQTSCAVRAEASERALQTWRQTPEMQIVKRVECSTGLITGFAKWTFYRTWRSEDLWDTRPTAPWAEGNHRRLVEQLLATTADIRGRRWGGKPHASKYLVSGLLWDEQLTASLVLGLLCVHPDYQRQGVGKALVRWGLQQAASMGLTVHLEASSEGLPLYRSLQFEVLETVIVKAEEWDGGFERRYVVVFWKPTNMIPEDSQD